ncbi:Hypothetical predicted protein [Olea europaea subsp. europaea]|uniref:Uncharacterized protein n=1 Tax=Olea europaea subsp. europaea TaxID=158383 RepID=A0A8S0TAA9_OLEEU|nr:Hypothetical predicted protein [Olea europaea subsp. europaea]
MEISGDQGVSGEAVTRKLLKGTVAMVDLAVLVEVVGEVASTMEKWGKVKEKGHVGFLIAEVALGKSIHAMCFANSISLLSLLSLDIYILF